MKPFTKMDYGRYFCDISRLTMPFASVYTNFAGRRSSQRVIEASKVVSCLGIVFIVLLSIRDAVPSEEDILQKREVCFGCNDPGKAAEFIKDNSVDSFRTVPF